MISYKYNIYHSRKTKYLEKMLRECCFVWNHALALQRRYYKLFGKYISVGKMKKYFAKRIKRNLLHSQTTQEILERLDESYNRFFKKLAKRPPKFKSPDKFNSFVFKQGGFTLNGNCLTINKGNYLPLPYKSILFQMPYLYIHRTGIGSRQGLPDPYSIISLCLLLFLFSPSLSSFLE